LTIFVRWRMEDNDQLLLLFYFIDDFQEFNIRGTWFGFGHIFDSDEANMEQICQFKPVISWAPSHVEQGRVSELLSLVNRINGSKARFAFHQEWNGLGLAGVQKYLAEINPQTHYVFNDCCKIITDLILNSAPRGQSKWLLEKGDTAVGFDHEPFVAFALTEQNIRRFTESFRTFEEGAKKSKS